MQQDEPLLSAMRLDQLNKLVSEVDPAHGKLKPKQSVPLKIFERFTYFVSPMLLRECFPIYDMELKRKKIAMKRYLLIFEVHRYISPIIVIVITVFGATIQLDQCHEALEHLI